MHGLGIPRAIQVQQTEAQGFGLAFGKTLNLKETTGGEFRLYRASTRLL